MKATASRGNRPVLIICLSVALIACSTSNLLAEGAIATQISGSGAVPVAVTSAATTDPAPATPTKTAQPTATTEPTATLTFTPVPPTREILYPTLPPPKGSPVPSWNDIPIMPGAIAGDARKSKKSHLAGDYLFIIETSQNDIQSYYGTQMIPLGWKQTQVVVGKGGYLMLVYDKGNLECVISAAPQDNTIYQVIISLFKS